MPTKFSFFIPVKSSFLKLNRKASILQTMCYVLISLPPQEFAFIHPRWDSNPQSLAQKASALSIRPLGYLLKMNRIAESGFDPSYTWLKQFALHCLKQTGQQRMVSTPKSLGLLPCTLPLHPSTFRYPNTILELTINGLGGQCLKPLWKCVISMTYTN